MEHDKDLSVKENVARRQVLKSVVAGSGTLAAGKALPESWVTPVIEAVSLPAHAATTGATIRELGPFQTISTQPIVLNDFSDLEQVAATDGDARDWDALSDEEILDFFVQPANALVCDVNSATFTGSFQMTGSADDTVGRLCLGAQFDDECLGGTSWFHEATLDGNTIPGGDGLPCDEVGGLTAEFGPFTLVGNQLQGSVTLRYYNLASTTDISTVLVPGGPGCAPCASK